MDQVRASAFLELFDEGTTLETKVEELNIDSLELIELIQEISAKFGPVPDEKVSKMLTKIDCTVGDMKELWDAIPA